MIFRMYLRYICFHVLILMRRILALLIATSAISNVGGRCQTETIRMRLTFFVCFISTPAYSIEIEKLFLRFLIVFHLTHQIFGRDIIHR